MSVRKRTTPKGTTVWMVDMALPNGQRHRKNHKTKEEAENAHHNMKVRIYEGTWALKEPEMIIFAALVPMYIGYCELSKSKSTVRSDECRIKLNLKKHFGDKFLTEITVDIVEDYKASVKERGLLPKALTMTFPCSRA